MRARTFTSSPLALKKKKAIGEEDIEEENEKEAAKEVAEEKPEQKVEKKKPKPKFLEELGTPLIARLFWTIIMYMI